MEQSWQSNPSFYQYYPNDRSSDRATSPPVGQGQGQGQGQGDQGPVPVAGGAGGQGPGSLAGGGEGNARRFSTPHAHPHDLHQPHQHAQFLSHAPLPHQGPGAGPSQTPGGGGHSGGGAGGAGGGGGTGGGGGGQGSGLVLPPFAQTFYSAYHPSPPQHHPSQLSSSSHGAHMFPSHLPPAHTHPGYSGYPGHSPVGMNAQLPSVNTVGGPHQQGLPPHQQHPHRQPPPHHYSGALGSPRTAALSVNTVSGPPPGSIGGVAGCQHSPPHHLPPLSPLHHLDTGPGPRTDSAFMGSAATAASSSSINTRSAQPSSSTKGRGGKTKRRDVSPTETMRSWSVDGEGDSGLTEEGGQPWGMPQDEYKALNPKDKKQVRNRIGARRFRAKRKDYVATIEAAARAKDDEMASLRIQLEAQRNEINEYRHRLGLPLVPPPPAPPPPSSGSNMPPSTGGSTVGSMPTNTPSGSTGPPRLSNGLLGPAQGTSGSNGNGLGLLTREDEWEMDKDER